ncbi:MAG: DUF1178 family protein [Betaproteobacteria bacterium]
MKVLDLQCHAQHRFEGWFASEGEFARQLEGGLLACPLCGSTSVGKRLSAPHLSLGSSRTPPSESLEPVVAPGGDAALQARWISALRQLVDNTEDVGEKFTDEARRIHYGEAEERGIRGQASAEQTRDLIEEGIQVLALPAALKEPLH